MSTASGIGNRIVFTAWMALAHLWEAGRLQVLTRDWSPAVPRTLSAAYSAGPPTPQPAIEPRGDIHEVINHTMRHSVGIVEDG